jgi:hypothetical protein
MTRNLAFRVLAPEMALLDAFVSILDVTKQEFMLEILRDGLHNAQSIIHARGWDDVFEQAYEKELAKMGLGLSDPNEAGERKLVVLGDQVEEHEEVNA